MTKIIRFNYQLTLMLLYKNIKPGDKIITTVFDIKNLLKPT